MSRRLRWRSSYLRANSATAWSARLRLLQEGGAQLGASRLETDLGLARGGQRFVQEALAFLLAASMMPCARASASNKRLSGSSMFFSTLFPNLSVGQVG
jgi:hypothetical protein